MRLLYLASILLLSNSAFAKPILIDVSGMIPGQSTKYNIDALKRESAMSPEYSTFKIGGFSLMCRDQYIEGVLSSLDCFTGEKYYSKDDTKGGIPASNIDIYVTLLNGFSKKFGDPVTIKNPVQTRSGATYSIDTSTWTDEDGNTFELTSMVGNLKDGMVQIKSAKAIALDKKNNENLESNRNF